MRTRRETRDQRLETRDFDSQKETIRHKKIHWVGASMRDYKKILAWQKADDLTVEIYEVTRSFPKEEIYSLTNQMRRAAYSAPSNIAEGASRSSQKDYLHFLYIARGSISETSYFIHLSKRLKYLSADNYARLEKQADEASRVLTGLIRSVEKDAGALSRAAAKITSAFVLAFSLRHIISSL